MNLFSFTLNDFCRTCEAWEHSLTLFGPPLKLGGRTLERKKLYRGAHSAQSEQVVGKASSIQKSIFGSERGWFSQLHQALKLVLVNSTTNSSLDSTTTQANPMQVKWTLLSLSMHELAHFWSALPFACFTQLPSYIKTPLALHLYSLSCSQVFMESSIIIFPNLGLGLGFEDLKFQP